MTINILETNETNDLPFYNGVPTAISDSRWLVLIGAVASAGLVDMYLTVPGPAWVAMWIRGIIFAGILLLAYLLATPGHATAIAAKLHRSDAKVIVACWLGTIAASSAAAVFISAVTDAHANPTGNTLASSTITQRVLLFAGMVPQLLGEELFTILLLLAVMSLASKHLHLSRNRALVLAVTISTLAFAALHLPTYGWNILQCVAIIGTARVVLLFAFLKTKNVLASTAAHVLNDWTLFGLGLLG